MGFQVSPGVVVTEKDLTTIVPAVSTTDGAFAGVFAWGPLNQVVLVGDENQLVATFGKPDDVTATSFFTAANFLAYGNKLRLVRVADTSSMVSYTGLVADAAANSEELIIAGTTLLTSNPRVRAGSIVAAVINGVEETRVVAAVSTRTVSGVLSTVLNLDETFADELDGQTVSVAAYSGALNATAEEGTGTAKPGIGALIQNDDDYENAVGTTRLQDCGPVIARYPGELGNSIRVSICPSEIAFKQKIAGVSSSELTDPVTGVKTPIITGTNFTNKLIEGSIVKDSVTGQERTIVSVTSDTQAVVSFAFSPALSSTEVTARWEFADAIGLPPTTSNFAQDKGSVNDELHVVVTDADGKISGTRGTILERFSFLSKAVDAKKEDGATNYYVNVLNKQSSYIRWADHLDLGTNWGTKALNTSFEPKLSKDFLGNPVAVTAVQRPFSFRLDGGRDANSAESTQAARFKGYDLFANAELIDVSLVLLGETPDVSLPLYVIGNICEKRKDCVAFISPPLAAVLNNPLKEVEDSIAFRNNLGSSSYAVMDSGWKRQYDKYNDTFRWIPLNGDIAGLCVRTDTNQDAWWSPAGYNRGNIKNCIKLAYNPFQGQRDDLYLNGINPVISTQGQGTILFGDKTLLSKPSAFDRINVRRLFIVLEKAIARAAKFMLFEFNDEFTRQQFRSLVEPFLRDVQARRGIYDFKVVCDRSNNTGEVIDRNEFVGDIYIKPARAINFIQLNFIAVRTGVDFSEIVGKA